MSKRHRKNKLFSDDDFGGSFDDSSYSSSARSEFSGAPRDLNFDDMDFGDSGESFTMRPAKRMKGKHRRGGAQKRAYYD